jgi:hypothetical protein
MKEIILKWWNRKWSNWGTHKLINEYCEDRVIAKYLILIKTSNDGLVKFKKEKIY